MNFNHVVRPIGVAFHVDDFFFRENFYAFGVFDVVAEDVAVGAAIIGADVRAEVVEVSVRGENVERVEVSLIVGGVDNSRGVVVIVKHQQNLFVANHETAVEQVIDIHKNFFLSNLKIFCKTFSPP